MIVAGVDDSRLKLLVSVEALHLAHLMAAHGYFFPVEDHILTVKNDGTLYRFQVGGPIIYSIVFIQHTLLMVTALTTESYIFSLLEQCWQIQLAQLVIEYGA